jgi:putative acyl-CoA dehydrogenase
MKSSTSPRRWSDYNLFDTNRPLRDALKLQRARAGYGAAGPAGRHCWAARMQAHARLANVHGPVLHSHDRFGRRVDQVEFHPSYHELMKLATGAGCMGRRGGTPSPRGRGDKFPGLFCLAPSPPGRGQG